MGARLGKTGSTVLLSKLARAPGAVESELLRAPTDAAVLTWVLLASEQGR